MIDVVDWSTTGIQAKLPFAICHNNKRKACFFSHFWPILSQRRPLHLEISIGRISVLDEFWRNGFRLCMVYGSSLDIDHPLLRRAPLPHNGNMANSNKHLANTAPLVLNNGPNNRYHKPVLEERHSFSQVSCINRIYDSKNRRTLRTMF